MCIQFYLCKIHDEIELCHITYVFLKNERVSKTDRGYGYAQAHSYLWSEQIMVKKKKNTTS